MATIKQQSILRVDPTCGTFKVGTCTDLSGQISMETESESCVGVWWEATCFNTM